MGMPLRQMSLDEDELMDELDVDVRMPMSMTDRLMSSDADMDADRIAPLGADEELTESQSTHHSPVYMHIEITYYCPSDNFVPILLFV